MPQAQVAVVIPTYNAALLLPNALNSILAQTMSDWEIIIIDDGSTDQTEELVRSHYADPRIRYIKQANGGVSAARNRGVVTTDAKYVAFLDDDDALTPDALNI